MKNLIIIALVSLYSFTESTFYKADYSELDTGYVVSSPCTFYKADYSELYIDTSMAIGKQIYLSWDGVPKNEKPKLYPLTESQFDYLLLEKAEQVRLKNENYYALKF